MHVGSAVCNGKMVPSRENRLISRIKKIKLATVTTPISHLLRGEHDERAWAMVWHVCSQARFGLCVFSVEKRTITGI